MAGRSALVVPITLPAALAAVRDASDPMAARGVPAHVTILFPFLAASSLGASDHDILADIARLHAAFVARFDQVEQREQLVWLLPADQSPFLDLTAAIVERWPDQPPYGGVHAALIAHLTLVETADPGVRDAAAAVAREVGPFEVAVSELLLITESMAGTWQTKWPLALETGPDRDGRC
jgi:hypothetical protein